MQVRFGRRQSVGVDAQVTTKEATRNFEAEKEEQVCPSSANTLSNTICLSFLVTKLFLFAELKVS